MKNTILGFVAVVATVVGVAYVTNTSVNVTTPAPVVNVEPSKVVVQSPDVNVQAPVVNVPRQQVLGAVSSQELPQPYLVIGGTEFATARQGALTQASSTLCALKSPSSTSTLIFAAINVRYATTTLVGVQLSNSTTPFASSTNTLGYDKVLAGGARLIVASTTQAYTNTVFLPNTYVVARMDNVGGSTTAAPGGSCEAMWLVVK